MGELAVFRRVGAAFFYFFQMASISSGWQTPAFSLLKAPVPPYEPLDELMNGPAGPLLNQCAERAINQRKADLPILLPGGSDRILSGLLEIRAILPQTYPARRQIRPVKTNPGRPRPISGRLKAGCRGDKSAKEKPQYLYLFFLGLFPGRT
jgi:hypothetical protein